MASGRGEAEVGLHGCSDLSPFSGGLMDLKNVIPGRSQRKNRRDIKDVESAIEALMAELKDLRDRVSRIEGKIENW